MIDLLNSILENITNYSIILFEFIGIIVIIFTGIKGVIDLIRRNSATKLNLAKGLALGLEFKLGSEILRTVLVRDLSEIVIVGAIILIRAALTILIHWEIKNEESHEKRIEEK